MDSPRHGANGFVQLLMLGSAALTVSAEVQGALGQHVDTVGLNRVELSLKVGNTPPSPVE